MIQLSLDEVSLNQENVSKPKRSGPPNRMNDLSYTEWMKFQKSFFRYESTELLFKECVHFFTKSVWDNGEKSESLIITSSDFSSESIPQRNVKALITLPSVEEVVNLLTKEVKSKNKFDFILIDFRLFFSKIEELNEFLDIYSDTFFAHLGKLLNEQKYCCILSGMEQYENISYPVPWSIALTSRNYLKLRDEKIALVENSSNVFYCLFMQKDKDECPASIFSPQLAKLELPYIQIPNWVIPKPPPRKKNEILHPAKYPETLVSEFIKIFTKPGDNVFDPMVGTGSTIIGAIKTGRNGYGTELIQKFVDIANERIESEYTPTLFEELLPKTKALAVQADATNLDDVNEIKSIKFHYVITSPPYWSMLSNPGSENQKARKEKNLSLVYSEDKRDLGNEEDYNTFISKLEVVYDQVAKKLVDKGYLTIVVKNVKRNHTIYPIAWDLVNRLCSITGKYRYLGTTLWCQDDVSLKPFAVGIHWVSNTVHHYCIHLRKKAE